MAAPSSNDSIHRLVILGGGIAGLHLATLLAGQRLPAGRLGVTLVDREPAHVWKPMLHTIAAGTRDVDQHQTQYLAQARRHGFTFQPGEVRHVDREARMVRLAPMVLHDEEILPERAIPFDTLVLALGSRANDFGVEGVSEHCATIDCRAEALSFNEAMRVRVLRSAARGEVLSVGIVGGGATGVQLAAELVHLAQEAASLGADAMHQDSRIVLIESGERLLAPFPKRIAQSVHERLVSLGIRVVVDTGVEAVDARGFRLADGARVDTDVKVWAAGVSAPACLATLDGLERTKAGQVVVGPSLQAPGDPAVLALGDCASYTPAGAERALPPTAQVAQQQARYLVRHLPAILAGRRVPPFRHRDFGALVMLGGFDAYASLGQFGLIPGGFVRGRVARLGHSLLYRRHQARLHGFWRGGLMWLADRINARVRAPIRVD
ncbi:NAD(P)/FAD-dependent oxidoreductase [Zavarzinia sp. CC-PAN008]|uniref:NAD(P)/FAD-dependent oxidoreductase n=1 Tax=Zavarzinia sp. CC-PAN008 TaxID=3243332 RepID=UPI003F74237B